MMGIKKALSLALAAGVLISPAAMAADIETPTTPYIFTSELLGLADATDVVFTGAIAVQLGSEYAIGDKVTLTFGGGALDDSTLPTSVVFACGGGNAGMTWGLLNSSTDHGTWRVTEIDTGTCAGASSTTGAVITFGPFASVQFNAQAVMANNGVLVSFSAETNAGDDLDTSGGDLRMADLFVIQPQINISVATAFSGIIDVNTDRTTLMPGPWDLATWSNTGIDGTLYPPDCCAGGFGTSYVNADVVWTGDFSWIYDQNPTDATTITPLAGVVVSSCGAVVVTATEISATCFGSETLTLNPAVNVGPGLATLPATSFTVTVVVNYTDSGFWDGTARPGVKNFNNLDAGEWGLNGYQAEVPYMPYGNNISQVIYLANRGSQTGDITVDYIDRAGNSASLGVVATINPNSTLAIGPAIKAALPANLRGNGRLALTITANIPAADGQLNSQYNVSGNRAFTLHEDNRP